MIEVISELAVLLCMLALVWTAQDMRFILLAGIIYIAMVIRHKE